jgi:ferritin
MFHAENSINLRRDTMLSKSMLEKLNKQLNLEFFSSNVYLQMSSWCESMSLEGCAVFLKHHAAEEQEHMERFYKYINEKGEMAIVGKIDEPPVSYKSVEEIFKKAFEHEKVVTRAIHDLVDAAIKEKDYTTQSFLQWFVDEQHEEETLFQSILDKMELIGLDKRGLYMFDKELAKLTEKES